MSKVDCNKCQHHGPDNSCHGMPWLASYRNGLHDCRHFKSREGGLWRRIWRRFRGQPSPALLAHILEGIDDARAGRGRSRGSFAKYVTDTAAGPWVRVDSGERPGELKEVLLRMPLGPCGVTLLGQYNSYDDRFVAVDAGPGVGPDFTHWARINLPEEDT